MKCALSLAMAFVSLVLLQAPAFAHADLKTAAPAAGSTVAKVKEIRLGFSEGVNPKFSGIDLKDQNGEKVAIGPAALDPKSTKELVVEVSEKLPAGSYTVEWHAVSDDTHRIKGQYSFKVTQ